eukprot:GHVT01031113.1.p1 GENE.GHVT01031113.1~~GHVT01031113.1.p1  ORF type:complete len:541 (-),score=115.51 GHVT01031113.1:1903-3348(-)
MTAGTSPKAASGLAPNAPASKKGLLWRVRALFSKSASSPQSAAENRVTFGLSRWLVLALFCVYCVLAGPSYVNWTPYADLLISGGAYEWKCEGAFDSSRAAHEAKCSEQQLAVDMLFTVGSACHFGLSMAAGLLLDAIGPKFTASLGVSSLLIGFVLLGSASKSVQTYIPGMIFVGFGTDSSFFPCLCGGNLFPGHVSAVIAVLGAFRSISFVVPLVLSQIAKNTTIASSSLLIGYAGVCLGLCCFIVALFVPRQAWRELQPAAKAKTLDAQDQQTAEEQTNEKLDLKDEATTAHHPHRRKNSEHQTAADEDPNDFLVPSPSVSLSRNPSAQRRTSNASQVSESGRRASAQAPRRRSSVASAVAPEMVLGAEEEVEGSAKEQMTLRQVLVSYKFLPLIPYFVITLVRAIFFIPAAPDLLPDAYEANQVISTFSFIPCPPLGWLANKIISYSQPRLLLLLPTSHYCTDARVVKGVDLSSPDQ